MRGTEYQNGYSTAVRSATLGAALVALLTFISMMWVQGADLNGRPKAGGEDTQDGPVTLEKLSGLLSPISDDYAMNGTEVGFGPNWYRDTSMARHDYDGDGEIETITGELDGLVGQNVTLQVERMPKGDFDVFAINGLKYRNVGDEPTPWDSMLDSLTQK